MAKLDTSILKPGDVIVVPQGNFWLRLLIGIGEGLRGHSFKYSKYGHVIVVHHVDEIGRLWGVEATPTGVGWRILDTFDGHFGLSNAEQPKTCAQRDRIVALLGKAVGSRYDYSAYIRLALEAIGITPQWTWLNEYSDTEVPPSWVCSALADWEYEQIGLANPGGGSITRFTTPDEWAKFIDKKEWENAS